MIGHWCLCGLKSCTRLAKLKECIAPKWLNIEEFLPSPFISAIYCSRHLGQSQISLEWIKQRQRLDVAPMSLPAHATQDDWADDGPSEEEADENSQASRSSSDDESPAETSELMRTKRNPGETVPSVSPVDAAALIPRPPHSRRPALREQSLPPLLPLAPREPSVQATDVPAASEAKVTEGVVPSLYIKTALMIADLNEEFPQDIPDVTACTTLDDAVALIDKAAIIQGFKTVKARNNVSGLFSRRQKTIHSYNLGDTVRIDLICQYGKANHKSRAKPGVSTLKRKRVSKRIGCPFQMSLYSYGGHISSKVKSNLHCHEPLLVDGKFVVTPAKLPAAKRKELCEKHVTGMRPNDIKALARQFAQEHFGTDDFEVRVNFDLQQQRHSSFDSSMNDLSVTSPASHRSPCCPAFSKHRLGSTRRRRRTAALCGYST